MERGDASCFLKKQTKIKMRFGQTIRLQFLFKLHPGILTKCKYVLHHAVKERDLNMVLQLILCKPALIDVVNKNGNTPLQLAIQMKFSQAVVAMIVHKPTSIHQINKSGETLLHLAVASGKFSILSCLLPFCSPPLLTKQHVSNKRTPLAMAVDKGLPDMVRMLVRANPAAVDIPDHDGFTPAFDAALSKNYDILMDLLEVCPQTIDGKDHRETNLNLLHVANDVRIAKRLLALKPNLIHETTKNDNCVLHCAISRMNTDLLQFYLTLKPDLLLHKNKSNISPLHMASYIGFREAVNTILQFKPDLIDTDQDKNTVLHAAVKAGDARVIETVFTNRMSNLNCENFDGKTPMCLAVDVANGCAVRLFEPHFELDRALALRESCQTKCGIDLEKRCLQECVTLNSFLLPDLVQIVFNYVGLSSKKRKLDHV